ncbi:MAG: cation acetate symporter, partial [Sciscionella sp.]|nr:cation acetate symporter [Sciscionella sp.]
DGRSARRTTVHVLLLIGLFYLFPTILGALSRLYTPELLVTGQTDAAILLLPTTMISGPVGKVVGAVVAAGAFSAFLSTCSGLISGVSGVVSTDLLRGRPHDSRLALSLVALVPLVAAIFLRPTDLALGVGMAFAFAASTFAPVLVLGVWWRGLTWVGAAAGMSVGGLLVLLALGVDVISRYTGDWAPHILLQPALLTVPMAFAVTAVVSRATPDRAPSNVNVLMMRLHTPDKLGLIRDRDIAEFGLADEKLRMMSGKHRRV